MSTAPATPPAAEKSGTPPPAEQQTGSFENFLSASIGAALKENPQMPTYEKDAPPSDTPPEPADKSVTPAENQLTARDTSQKTPDTSVTSEGQGDSGNPLIPDFGKLAFGKDLAVKVPVAPEPKDKGLEIPSPDQFPEKLPGKTTAQLQDAWASLRKTNNTIYHQLKEANDQLKAANERLKEFDGKTPMDRDEFGRITSERDELVKELRLSKLEATPEYKSAVTKPWTSIEDQIKRFATKYGIHEHLVRRAVTEGDPDKQGEYLTQVTETFNDRDKLTLFKVADSAVEIARKREVLHKDVKQALDYIDAKRNADNEAQVAAAKQEWTGALTKAWESIGEGLYLARPIEGNDEWNNDLKESQKIVANTNWEGLNKVDRAKIMVQAAILPRACVAIAKLWDMYNQASTALKRYQGVTPGAGSGSSAAGTEVLPPSANGEELGFVDAVEARFGSGGRR